MTEHNFGANPCDICDHEYIGCEEKCRRYKDFKKNLKKKSVEKRKNSSKKHEIYK